MKENTSLCEDCGVNEVEFADERICAWCIAKHREEEDK